MFFKNQKIQISKGWEDAGKKGFYLTSVFTNGKREWAVVIWENEDDPDLIKGEALESVD